MKKKFLIITTIPLSLGFFVGQIQFLKNEFDVEVASSPGDKLNAICKKERVIGHGISMQRNISVFKDIVSLVQLVFLCLKVKPFILHGSTPKAGLLSMVAGWITSVPHRIYYVHGLRYQGALGFKRKLLMRMEQITCFFATEIIAVSKGVKACLLNDSITKKEIHIIWNGSVNGIDLNFFNANNNSIPRINNLKSIHQSHFVFGFVGRLVKDKGIHELVTAFIEIKKKYAHTKLLLVGDFEEALDPIDVHVKEEIYANDAIIFVGFQSDIRAYLKEMDVFVLPSYREGFGVALMEAAAMNVPAITSNIIGCNEIIKDGYNGKLIAPKSIKELYSAMEQYIQDTSLLQRQSNEARNYVSEKYNQQIVWQETLKFYKNLSTKNS